MTERGKPLFVFLPDADEADHLLDQADAFLHKHRASLTADDDMPVLTEIVTDEDRTPDDDTGDVTNLPAAAPNAATPDRLPPDFVEQLIELDAVIMHRIDTWLQNQLPAMIDAQLDSIKLKLREEIHAQMRATLIADISRDISDLLDANDPRDR